jgi:hypothetical protein
MPIRTKARRQQAPRKSDIPNTICAELIGSTTATAAGISVTAYAPVLELCRRLVAAGRDPAAPLRAYRGDVLALRVGLPKFRVVCTDFRPLVCNTLRGFATIAIADLKLVVHDVAIHQNNDARWAALPAKPQVKDGALIKDAATGKIAYVTVLEFTDREVREVFSAAVVNAVLKHAADAFDALEAVVQ